MDYYQTYDFINIAIDKSSSLNFFKSFNIFDNLTIQYNLNDVSFIPLEYVENVPSVAKHQILEIIQ